MPAVEFALGGASASRAVVWKLKVETRRAPGVRLGAPPKASEADSIILRIAFFVDKGARGAPHKKHTGSQMCARVVQSASALAHI